VAQIGCAASKYLPVVYLKNIFNVQEAITTTLYASGLAALLTGAS
jgi:hypothetical protein